MRLLLTHDYKLSIQGLALFAHNVLASFITVQDLLPLSQKNVLFFGAKICYAKSRKQRICYYLFEIFCSNC